MWLKAEHGSNKRQWQGCTSQRCYVPLAEQGS